jgi:hypothetical protein
MAGIVQEQHGDRARLFMQWKQMDWPILVDSLNLLNVSVVPITFAIDEHGVIRHVNPSPGTIEAEFLDVTYAPPTPPAPPLTPRRPTLRDLEYVRPTLSPPDVARYGHARFLWSPEAGLQAVVAAYDETLRHDPDDARTSFRRGVALRARHDSPARESGDFAAAVESWQRALDLDPNQYIWRRRIQQYGPRLGKPYPFYDWVPEAREQLRGRGETPAPLAVEPGGAEFAHPATEFVVGHGTDRRDPDPDGRIHRDRREFIDVETVLVPPVLAPGAVGRLHLEFRPIEARKAHWNNEADDLEVWLDVPAGYEAERRWLTVPNPADVVSTEVRRVEVEVRMPPGTDSASARLRGYALYYVCEDIDGTCLYRRQDFELEIPVRRP